MQVVIGAGPAGLAIGFELHRRGHEVLVLEASDRIGGTAASIDVAGIRVDLGSHRLDPSMPGWVRTELEELVDLQERQHAGRLLVAGRWVPFPRTGLGLLRGRPRTVRMVDEPLARKVSGVPPGALVADPVRCRDEATAGGLLRATARRIVTPATFLYPARGGFGAIVDALAAGVRVETGRRVTRLIEHDDRVIVGLSDGRLVSAAHVHATLPAWQVTAMLDLHHEPSPPRSRAVVLVYLVLDRRPYTAFDTHVLPDRQLLPARVSEPTQYRDDPADPPGRTVLCAEVPCWVGDDVWIAPDVALVQRVCDDLVRAGLPDPRPVTSHVERLPSVHPVLTRGGAGALGRAERALSLSRRVTAVWPAVPGPRALVHDLQVGLAAARCVADDGSFHHDAWRATHAEFRCSGAPE